MEHWLLNFAERFGYVAVFLGVGMESLGIPVPGETSLLIGVVLAASGHFSILAMAVTGWLGAVLGDNAGYWVGRKWGERITKWPGLRRIYTPANLATAERFFARWGWWAVFAGRFVALLRILAGPLAGMHKMSWRKFGTANALGALVWVIAITLVGVILGSNLDLAIKLLRRSGMAGLGAAILLIIAIWIWRRRKHHE